MLQKLLLQIPLFKIFEKRVGVQGEGEKLLQKFFSLPLLNATGLFYIWINADQSKIGFT